jgi:DNA-binding transcriptional ArsR family regulator
MNAFAALADNNRREIVKLIAHRGELSASEISEEFTITPPAVSQHLKILREAKVIQMKKQAQKRLYSVDEAGLSEVSEWISEIRKQWIDRYNNLDNLLTKLKKGDSNES